MNVRKLDENWAANVSTPVASRKLHNYYRILSTLHPHIPPKLYVHFKSDLGAISDVGWNTQYTDMRFDLNKVPLYKMIVRQFLHEMVHVIWPRQKHGLKFEQKIMRLRSTLFADSMAIF